MHRRSLSGVRLPDAGRAEREDIGDIERAREEIWVAREVRQSKFSSAGGEDGINGLMCGGREGIEEGKQEPDNP
jgi:hypothetical protein